MKQDQYEITFRKEHQQPQQKIITLDQPVSTTLMRDIENIYVKLRYAMIPSLRQSGKKQLRNWDLWGPLVLCLLLSLTLSLRAHESTQAVVTIVFVIMWIGSLVVWLNAYFLGAHMSFFQSASLLGYCLFPVNIASFFAWLLGSYLPILLKLLMVLLSFIWASLSSIAFLGEMVPQRKRKLALYPICLFYLFLSWFVLIV